jgi:hypothetical protein
MRARVWAAGGVKVNMQQISSNFQDSDNELCDYKW